MATPGLRILLVEDYPDCAASTAQLLALWGHDVEAASDGSAAVTLTREHHPDVVLLDIGLPGGMDGWAVARCIREQGRAGCPLLIAITGYGQEGDRRRSDEAGIDAHLLKPVDPDQLKHLLDKWQAHLEYRRHV